MLEVSSFNNKVNTSLLKINYWSNSSRHCRSYWKWKYLLYNTVHVPQPMSLSAICLSSIGTAFPRTKQSSYSQIFSTLIVQDETCRFIVEIHRKYANTIQCLWLSRQLCELAHNSFLRQRQKMQWVFLLFLENSFFLCLMWLSLYSFSSQLQSSLFLL